ncbi:uncharacterized protein [Rutidosis leptorrhynchoides]|uniref:uncharacterized protein n=1 Tax=Rutidosis leptorrhynchoides TaxID=125765 RepID=UPI003A995E5F
MGIRELGCNISNEFVKYVGQGNDTSFWNEPWCGDSSFRILFPRLYRLEQNKHAFVTDRIKWIDGSAIFCWKWTQEPKWRTNSELACLTTLISNFVPPGLSSDKWIWKLGNNGIFSSRSLNSTIDKLSVAARVPFKPTSLNNLIPQKIGIFIWRASKNKLPVRTELDKRGIDLHSTRCPVCDEDIKTLQHSLISCKIATEVWDSIRIWWKLDLLHINNISDIEKASNPALKQSMLASFWQAVVWVTSYYLWKNRNAHVFRNNPLCPPKIVADIQSKSFEWLNCRGKNFD